MTETKAIVWPPEYKLKRHPRARRVKLTVSRANGLQITIPMRFSMKNIPDVLIEHEEWIRKHLAKLAERTTDELPEKIEFQSINETWKIHYMQSSNAKLKLIERPGCEIVLLGNVEDKVACKSLLITWVKKMAKFHLILRFNHVCNEIQLYCDKASIRDQETRWGSCNHKKLINLNYRLIFLPLHLAVHVMVHELCHTKYLNHSDRFWKLVSKFDANWEIHKKELRTADKYVPGWI